MSTVCVSTPSSEALSLESPPSYDTLISRNFSLFCDQKRVHSSTHQGGMKSWIFISWKPAALERVRWWAQCALRRFTKVFCRVDPPNQDLTLCCGLSEPFSSSPLLLVKHFVFRDIYKKSFWDICNSTFHVSAQSWFFNAGYLMHTKNQCNIHNVCYIVAKHSSQVHNWKHLHRT